MLPYVLRSYKVIIFSPTLNITNQLAQDFGISKSVRETFFFKTNIISNTDVLLNFLESGKIIKSSSDIASMSLDNLVIVNCTTSLLYNNNEMLKEAFQYFTTIIIYEALLFSSNRWKTIVDIFRGKQIIFQTTTTCN